jgi:3-hydroxyacyl-CoA dehydrogenase
MEKIAVVGAGLIGCAWATVFARRAKRRMNERHVAAANVKVDIKL